MNYCSLCGKECDLIYKSMKNTTPISSCCGVTVSDEPKEMLRLKQNDCDEPIIDIIIINGEKYNAVDDIDDCCCNGCDLDKRTTCILGSLCDKQKTIFKKENK